MSQLLSLQTANDKVDNLSKENKSTHFIITCALFALCVYLSFQKIKMISAHFVWFNFFPSSRCWFNVMRFTCSLSLVATLCLSFFILFFIFLENFPSILFYSYPKTTYIYLRHTYGWFHTVLFYFVQLLLTWKKRKRKRRERRKTQMYTL